MNDCENCRHINYLGLPDWSTMPCAVCARYGADNDPTMWEAKPQTNYDRIISMKPEELAIAICTDFGGIPWCKNIPECQDTLCVGCVVKWLKQEAK